jgi:hypothetical protein
MADHIDALTAKTEDLMALNLALTAQQDAHNANENESP